MKFPSFREMILYEDDDLIVVNKPPYLSSLDERNPAVPNLLKLARKYNSQARLCHRIDKETSGALIISKNDETYRHISMQFQNREIVKIYHAIAEGVQKFEEQEVNLPLIEVKGKAKIDKKAGKPAVTIVSSIRNYRHFTICLCMPLTGRYHQIRIHLSALKAPIAADTTYGGKLPVLSAIKRDYKPGKKQETPAINRVALHAFALNFIRPSGEGLTVEADYPDDLKTFLKILEKYDT